MALTESDLDPAPLDAAGVAEVVESAGKRRSRLILAGGLFSMGVLHFVMPKPFDKIIPRWVPFGSARTWTYISGVWELSSAALLAMPRTRRVGAYAAAATIVAVYPANIQMAIDNPPSTLLGVGMAARLPLQIPMIAWALRHRK
jgi:uncharacterized membrane protein